MILILGMLYYATSLFDGLNYEKLNTVINNKPEEIHTLSIDTSKEEIRIENGFSFGVLYGFEETSLIAERDEALCAVNGMFYEDFGLPMGMVIHDNIPVLSYDIGTPSVVFDEDGSCQIIDMDMKLFAVGESVEIELFGVNGRVPNGSWGVFTSLYGSTTRIRRDSTNYLITDGIVTEIISTNSPVTVKESDYVLSYAGFDYTFNIGDKVAIEMDTFIEENERNIAEGIEGDSLDVEEAFQTGGWLVYDGENVANEYETFVGYTTAAQPRTLVGLKGDGTLLLVVVDGRDSDRSMGLSGKEAAELMIDKGCVSAAYLDGGASSTMVIEGNVVNKPSGDGERAIAHSILIYVDK